MIPPSEIKELVKWARANKLDGVDVQWNAGMWYGAIRKGDQDIEAKSNTEAGLCVALYSLARTKLLGRG